MLKFRQQNSINSINAIYGVNSVYGILRYNGSIKFNFGRHNMATSAVNVSIDYGAYSEVQLSALLDEIQSQKAILDDRERQIRKAISSLDTKAKSKKEEKAFYNPENVAILKARYERTQKGQGLTNRDIIDA